MKLLDALLVDLPDGEVVEARIGLHWTVVVIETGGERRCGLASTLPGGNDHHKEADIPLAGQLESLSGRALVDFCRQDRLVLRSLGFAALNALLPRHPESWTERNAEEYIAQYGTDKTVAMVGRFPFVERLKTRVGELIVLEKNPGPDDLPESMAPEVFVRAEVIAITGMTLLNDTLEDLLSLCPSQAKVMLLGPSTPLNPVLFDYGIDLLSGALVTSIGPVLRTASQGGNFRQIHRAGVRLVNMIRPD